MKRYGKGSTRTCRYVTMQPICKVLKEFGGQFKMYCAGVHPMKATSMHWTDHKIRAMG